MKKYFILGAMLFNFTHTTVHADSPTIQDSAKGELLSDTSVSTLTEYKEKIAKLSELTTKKKKISLRSFIQLHLKMILKKF